MRCASCHGYGVMMRTETVPCPDCAGSGIAYCCEGDRHEGGRRNPIAKAVRRLRPKVVPSGKIYSRKRGVEQPGSSSGS